MSESNVSNNPGSKTWGTVVYPEDLPEWFTWEAFSTLVSCKLWISPVHDSDYFTLEDMQRGGEVKSRYATVEAYNEYTGSELTEEQYNFTYWCNVQKKAHLHLVMTFHQSKRQKAVEGLLQAAFSMLGVDELKLVCEAKASMSKSVEYLVHFNHPTKAQYDRSQIQMFNGADFKRCFIYQSDENELKQLLDLIVCSGIDEYNLMYMFVSVNRPDLLPAFIDRNNTMQISNMIKSNKFSPVQRLFSNEVIDVSTGDVIIGHSDTCASLDNCIRYLSSGNDNLRYVNSYFAAHPF